MRASADLLRRSWCGHGEARLQVSDGSPLSAGLRGYDDEKMVEMD